MRLSETGIGPFRDTIIRRFPELRGSIFRLMTTGWDSIAVDVDDRLIFKFPRDASAERRLWKETALLRLVRPAVSLAVPDMRLHDEPPLFSSHVKLLGDHLESDHYRNLPENRRTLLAETLARFYADLHRLDRAAMEAAGARPIDAWQSADRIREKAIPVLPTDLRAPAIEAVEAFEQLPADPHGTTYGFFDGHGWNMAFDHARGRLNGIYDFADSGIGPLHQDFIYTSFVSPDLTERVAAAYEAMTGRSLDRRRIALLTGVHRLSELAELADAPEHVATKVRFVAEWAGMTERPG